MDQCHFAPDDTEPERKPGALQCLHWPKLRSMETFVMLDRSAAKPYHPMILPLVNTLAWELNWSICLSGQCQSLSSMACTTEMPIPQNRKRWRSADEIFNLGDGRTLASKAICSPTSSYTISRHFLA